MILKRDTRELASADLKWTIFDAVESSQTVFYCWPEALAYTHLQFYAQKSSHFTKTKNNSHFSSLRNSILK